MHVHIPEPHLKSYGQIVHDTHGSEQPESQNERSAPMILPPAPRPVPHLSVSDPDREKRRKRE